MMKRSQSYLGMVNAVVMCADECVPQLRGRFVHHFQKEPVVFESEIDLLEKMEDFFDALRFPFPGNSERHWHKKEVNYMKEELQKELEDEEMLDMHGDLGTFIIRVQHRQNSSWQGRITWVEEDKTLYFRSVWEMMKLIEEALAEHRKEDSPGWEK